MERSRVRWTVLLGALLLLPGCGSINSYASGCPGPYSGVRQDLELLESYRGDAALQPAVPVGFDGTLGSAWDAAFVALDVPLAALLDTLALPVTAPTGTRAPLPAGLGCGWAEAPDATVEDS
ncbi:MAG: YceK/YidQ family lipoprotein [Myxococcota bacterium]